MQTYSANWLRLAKPLIYMQSVSKVRHSDSNQHLNQISILLLLPTLPNIQASEDVAFGNMPTGLYIAKGEAVGGGQCLNVSC